MHDYGEDRVTCFRDVAAHRQIVKDSLKLAAWAAPISSVPSCICNFVVNLAFPDLGDDVQFPGLTARAFFACWGEISAITAIQHPLPLSVN
jgi:hypothetical protein